MTAETHLGIPSAIPGRAGYTSHPTLLHAATVRNLFPSGKLYNNYSSHSRPRSIFA